MSTKESAALIREQAIKSIIVRLEGEQKKLKYSINRRTYELQDLTRKQTQEKREKAELGDIIKKLNA